MLPVTGVARDHIGNSQLSNQIRISQTSNGRPAVRPGYTVQEGRCIRQLHTDVVIANARSDLTADLGLMSHHEPAIRTDFNAVTDICLTTHRSTSVPWTISAANGTGGLQ